MKWLWWIACCCCWQLLPAQEIQYLRTTYSDDFREWQFFDQDEQEIGSLRARWVFSDDLSQWDVRMGEWSGSVQLRWKDRPDEWEVRLQNDFFTAAPTWPGQIDSWRITNHDDTYYLKLERDPDGFQWSLEKGANTLFYVYNEYFLDLRDWVVSYEVNEPLPASLMLTTLFLVSYYSTPK